MSVTLLLAAAAVVVATRQPSEAPAGPEPVAVRTGGPALPPAGGWDYQIGGVTAYRPAPAVVSRDGGALPWPGVYSICYVNAFQSQPGDTSLTTSWLVVGGSPVEDPEWPGEFLLDTRTRRVQLVTAFRGLLASCADKGFQAVEFDNLDSYERSKGGLTAADNLAYVTDLIEAAHGLGLATAQKNAAELVGRAPFDFAVVESCLKYSECSDFTSAYGVVLDVEYGEEMSAATFQKECAAAVRTGRPPSFVFRDRAVTAGGVRAWCTAQAFR